MAPQNEQSSLKRGRASVDQDSQDQKKPRRSERISSRAQPQNTPIEQEYLPTPVTRQSSTVTDARNDTTATPTDEASQVCDQTSINLEPLEDTQPEDTQAFSQFVYPPRAFADEVEDGDVEGVWGYLIPLDDTVHSALSLTKRDSCQGPRNNGDEGRDKDSGNGKKGSCRPGGYLIGRHPECDLLLEIPTISNRHFMLFSENKKGDVVAMLQDLSSNGTFINDAIVGRNKHRELEDGDEISILNEARFVFRYPKSRDTNGFRQQYRILQQLGKGHFATVYLCAERATGTQYAVKVFEKRPGDSQKTHADALQQEIALLMSVNHENLLCLKDTFDESDGMYLIMEVASEGELFNLIVSKQNLSEDETRHVFKQLFEGLKYLHDRGIVHRDIKPENILVSDKKLSVKLGDFGLAKIIGEDSFTTTLCGTPSYVAPEILQDTNYRRYTKAVDIWSLGVVLYICLCGFPPFSDELYTRQNPYTMAQQIKMGRFDYPSPYWDSVGDPALDLIDRMLTVNADQRITVEECLEHPWLLGKSSSLTDSTDGLTGALDNLDFSKRKVERERTLLSSMNDIRFSERAEEGGAPVKIFHKNEAGKRVSNQPSQVLVHQSEPEARPNENSAPQDFANLGERGDPLLYEQEPTSRYP
ncbi:CAMK family serine/threonine-protein kinase [Aspergillus ruber CBS 135680]|uniref:Serine/threonine-protein kinase chk2 n=1 Tax=Aspergillus ruber (strain CBS 135680) TaxID=1388766 RepID=A0A017S905_ASPRC|nr:serine/threonine-protein kinase chk2 [Aspergillus ruber CBS 135680]EYE93306.1 serine/threonine-protein kinase chk2 [Aspergillus ruber CBS 135680]